MLKFQERQIYILPIQIFHIVKYEYDSRLEIRVRS